MKLYTAVILLMVVSMVMATNMRKEFFRPFEEDEREVNKVGGFEHSHRHEKIYHITNSNDWINNA